MKFKHFIENKGTKRKRNSFDPSWRSAEKAKASGGNGWNRGRANWAL